MPTSESNNSAVPATNDHKSLDGLPDGWVTDGYTIDGEKWFLAYSPEENNRRLYIGDALVIESDDDNFSFDRDGCSIRVVRHLRGGFYELEILRGEESRFSGRPTSSKVKGLKNNLMIAGYILFAIWFFMRLREQIGF